MNRSIAALAAAVACAPAAIAQDTMHRRRLNSAAAAGGLRHARLQYQPPESTTP
jgi:hypothetical protein